MFATLAHTPPLALLDDDGDHHSQEAFLAQDAQPALVYDEQVELDGQVLTA